MNIAATKPGRAGRPSATRGQELKTGNHQPNTHFHRVLLDALSWINETRVRRHRRGLDL